MKITIDTKEDSLDEIKRVVKMLEAWTEGHTNAPFSMFGDMGSGSGSSPSSSSGSDSGSGGDIFSLFGDKSSENKESSPTIAENKEEEMPEIVPY
ncbi:hypothetical protein COV19_03995 [Candidatus Woesearchaeota archaeon CG10_big_fil_rev_8_21_14_0_10_44_13]|nr:MAG: hypothetical protein COV19_03995 [Candidatus Woesearchaeota archaeon CG10_big_fil_rev_8_21_14_0_10_44_13]